MYPFIRTSASYRVLQRSAGEIRYAPLSDVTIDSVTPADDGSYSVSLTSANPFFRQAWKSGAEFDLLAVSGKHPATEYANAENGTSLFGLRIESVGTSSLATSNDQSGIVRQQIAATARSVAGFSKMTVVTLPDLSTYCNYTAEAIEHNGHLFVLAVSVSASLSVSILTRSPDGRWKKNPLDIDDLATPATARIWPFRMALSGAFLIVTVDVSVTNASTTGRQNVILVPIPALMRADEGVEVKVSNILSIGQTPRCTYLRCDEDEGMMVFSDGSAYSISRGGLPLAEPALFNGSGSAVGSRIGDAWLLATSSSSNSAHVIHAFKRGRWTHRTAYGLGAYGITSISVRDGQITLTQSSGAVYVASSTAYDFAQIGAAPIANVAYLDVGAGVSYQCSGDTLYRGLDALSIGVEGLTVAGTSLGLPRYAVIARPSACRSGVVVCGAVSSRQNIYAYPAAAELFSTAKPLLMEVEC